MSDLQMKKGAAPHQENAPFEKPLQSKHNKESMILAIFRSGNSLNRFEAERFGDHCLHSTVATLRSKGYLFHDVWEWVPTRFGKEVHVKRYSYIGLGQKQSLPNLDVKTTKNGAIDQGKDYQKRTLSLPETDALEHGAR